MLFAHHTNYPTTNHTSYQIFQAVEVNPRENTIEDILFYYSFWILNHYRKELEGKNRQDVISFVKKHAFSDLKRLHYTVTDEMFRTHVEETMRSRLMLDKHPSGVMALLNSTQEATALIQRAMRH